MKKVHDAIKEIAPEGTIVGVLPVQTHENRQSNVIILGNRLSLETADSISLSQQLYSHFQDPEQELTEKIVATINQLIQQFYDRLIGEIQNPPVPEQPRKRREPIEISNEEAANIERILWLTKERGEKIRRLNEIFLAAKTMAA